MQMMRHLERRETLAYWPASNEQSGETIGLVTDLSEDGLSIHSHTAFSVGQKVNLRVTVDPHLTGVKAIHLHAIVIWSHQSGMNGHYHAGFKLVDKSPDACEALLKLLASFSYPAPHTRDNP